MQCDQYFSKSLLSRMYHLKAFYNIKEIDLGQQIVIQVVVLELE